MHKMDLYSNCVVVRHIQLHTKVYVLCSYNLISLLVRHMDNGHILCVVHLLGCCELNFFVDKYYPSDSQSQPGKDMNKMCNIISSLLALGTASLFSRVRSRWGQLSFVSSVSHVTKSPLKTICHCIMQRQLDCTGDLDTFKSYHTTRKDGVVHHVV